MLEIYMERVGLVPPFCAKLTDEEKLAIQADVRAWWKQWFAEHPDHTVRNSAISILSTCSSPPAVAWRKQATANKAALAAAGGTDSEATPAAPATAVATRPALATAVAASPPPAAGSAAWIAWLIVAMAVIGGVAFWRIRSRRPDPVAGPTGGKHITWAR